MPDKQMISLIHPSCQRPKEALAAAQKWISTAGTSIEYFLSLDVNDPSEQDYLRLFSGNWMLDPNNPKDKKTLLINQNRSAIDAINNAAKVATGDILVQMADDFDCPEDWGLKIIEATKGKTDWILKTQDGIQKWIITLPIMDLAYYNRFGYIYFPEYRHMFCDTELSCVADLTGRRLESQILFPHNHYSVTKKTPDEVSRRADSTWAQGEKLFIERYKRNFDLVNPPGKITSQEYINWIRQKL